MAKNKIVRDSKSGKFAGVSTAADVRTFRSANTALTEKVTSTRDAARTYVKVLEQRVGLTSKKK